MRNPEYSLTFEERQLLHSCHFTSYDLASLASSVFTWPPLLALWTEILQPWEPAFRTIELELKSILLHFLLSVTLLPPGITHVFKIVLSFLIFYKLEAQNVSAVMSTNMVGVIWVAFVYLLHTHTVCLAWQPAGLGNNNASV